VNESIATPPLIVSTSDYARLEALLASDAGAASPIAAQLEQELLRAELREPAEVPADVVTMNSEVVCADESAGTERRLRLVYPRDADAASGRISVLAPVGAALLGLSVGQSIDWPLPGGRRTRLRVTSTSGLTPPAGTAGG
jgi:regulator of nucleoside diphosphate kinase